MLLDPEVVNIGSLVVVEEEQQLLTDLVELVEEVVELVDLMLAVVMVDMNLELVVVMD